MKTGRRKVRRRPKRRHPNCGWQVVISYQDKGGHNLMKNGPIRFLIATEKDEDLRIQCRAVCATVVVAPISTSHTSAPTSDWSIREGGEGAILEKRIKRQYEVTAKGFLAGKRNWSAAGLLINGMDVTRIPASCWPAPPYLCVRKKIFSFSKRKGPSKSLLYFCSYFYTHPYVYRTCKDRQRGESLIPEISLNELCV